MQYIFNSFLAWRCLQKETGAQTENWKGNKGEKRPRTGYSEDRSIDKCPEKEDQITERSTWAWNEWL